MKRDGGLLRCVIGLTFVIPARGRNDEEGVIDAFGSVQSTHAKMRINNIRVRRKIVGRS